MSIINTIRRARHNVLNILTNRSIRRSIKNSIRGWSLKDHWTEEDFKSAEFAVINEQTYAIRLPNRYISYMCQTVLSWQTKIDLWNGGEHGYISDLVSEDQWQPLFPPREKKIKSPLARIINENMKNENVNYVDCLNS